MTEAEWLACDSPMTLFNYLHQDSPWREEREGWTRRVAGWLRLTRTSRPLDPTRRLYLLACGVNQLWWRLVSGADALPPFLVLEERFAEGEVTLEELLGADPERQWWWPYPWHLVSNVFRRGIFFRAAGTSFEGAGSAYCDLTRDIFGNPFRPVVCDPSWLTSDVLALARGIYAEKAFDRMPILADALQDAGCANEDVLSHCRAASATHVRGCWVVDLVLGKGEAGLLQPRSGDRC